MNEIANTFKVSTSDTLGKDKLMTAITITDPDTMKTLVVNCNPAGKYNEFPGIVFSISDRRKPNQLFSRYEPSEIIASIHLNKATLLKLIIELSKML